MMCVSVKPFKNKSRGVASCSWQPGLRVPAIKKTDRRVLGRGRQTFPCAAARHGVPPAIKAGRSKERACPRSLEGEWSCDTLFSDSAFRLWENTFCSELLFFWHSIVGSLYQLPVYLIS